MRYTGKRAAQVVNGITRMVINLSFQLSIFRVAITAGMAQAVPETRGTMLFPLKPNRLIILSIKNTTLLIYPLSSRIEINRNKNAIWGINITIPLNPGMIPSASKLVNWPGGIIFRVHSLREAKVTSIKSIG